MVRCNQGIDGLGHLGYASVHFLYVVGGESFRQLAQQGLAQKRMKLSSLARLAAPAEKAQIVRLGNPGPRLRAADGRFRVREEGDHSVRGDAIQHGRADKKQFEIDWKMPDDLLCKEVIDRARCPGQRMRQ